jgi:hypothetical protein
MATRERSALDSVEDEIVRLLELDGVHDGVTTGGAITSVVRARMVLELAEAHAWLRNAAQAHG